MELMVTLLFICGAISLGLISVGGGLVLRGRRKLTGRPMAATDYLTDPPKALDYGYIDFLERELEVGRYDPDRIALGFDDTKPEPKPLDPEIDELPMPDAVKADEGCPCGVCRSQRRSRESEELVDRLLADLNEAKPKPVDDSWADENIRDGVYGPKTGGLLRRIVDNHGNWTEIRSFGG